MTTIIDRLIEHSDRHREADEFIQGHYARGHRGCVIGCAVRDCVAEGALPKSTSPDDHEALSRATGVPEMVLHLADMFFECSIASEAPSWSPRFWRAARGRDLSLAWPRFARWLLSEPDSPPMYAASQDDSVRDAIVGVARLYREWLDTGQKPARDRFAAAAEAAWAARAAAAWAAQRALRDKFIEIIESCPTMGDAAP